MQIILDASAAVDLLVPTERGERIAQFLLAMTADVHVPAHFRIEGIQALRGLLRRGLLSEERAAQALDDLLALSCTVWPDEVGLRRVWELRDGLSAYDAGYLALAEALDSIIVTSDQRFARAAQAAGSAPVIVF